MVTVYSLTPAPGTKPEDALYAAWDQVQRARGMAFDPDRPDGWRDGVASLLESVAMPLSLSVSHYKGKPEDLRQLAEIASRVRDLLGEVLALSRPKVSDVIRVSELLITIEIDVARLRNRTAPAAPASDSGGEPAHLPQAAPQANAASPPCPHPRPWRVEVKTGRVVRAGCTTCQAS